MKKRYFILSALFLFNPIVSVFDILPDFIGYFLLMKAFTDASYVFDNADETHQAFKKMGILSLFKLLSMIILPFTDATMALVFSFTFAILEAMYGIGAFQRLFDTTSFICLRCGEERFVSKSERLKRFTTGFFITRILCSTVPDLFTLFLSDPAMAWKARFRILAFIFTVSISLIVGLIWLAKFTSFFKKSLTKEVDDKIRADFKEEMKDRQGVFFSKDFIFAIGILIASMLFAIDFSIDNLDLLFDIALAPLLVIAFAFLAKKSYIRIQRPEKLLITVACAHFIVSILNMIFTNRYFKSHLSTSALYLSEARTDFLPIRILTIIESLAFFAIVFTTLSLVMKYSVQRIKENPKFFSEYSVEGYLKEFSRVSRKKCILSIVFAGAYASTSGVYPLLLPRLEAFVVINMLVGLLFFVSFISAMSYISDEVFKRILKYS